MFVHKTATIITHLKLIFLFLRFLFFILNINILLLFLQTYTENLVMFRFFRFRNQNILLLSFILGLVNDGQILIGLIILLEILAVG